MISCPDVSCSWKVQKTILKGPKCCWCRADLAPLLDGTTLAAFASKCSPGGPAPVADGTATVADGTAPAAATSHGPPAIDRSRPAKAAPWRAHLCIDAEKTRLQAFLEEAEEERRHCGGVVQETLLKNIAKSEAAIIALDDNSGSPAPDRLGYDAKLREFQQ